MVIPDRPGKTSGARSAGARNAGSDAERRFRAALSKSSVSQNPAFDPIDAGSDIDADHGDRAPDPAEDQPALHSLRELWDQLVLTLREGRRLSSDHWSLSLRLDEEAFPQTTLTLVCVAGELSITLRTVGDTEYQRLQSQIPELNQRLQRHVGNGTAQVLQVPVEELDS